MPSATKVQPIRVMVNFGGTHSEADLTFSKRKGSPGARGASRGNLSPFTKDQVNFRVRLSKIDHNPNWLYFSYTEHV